MDFKALAAQAAATENQSEAKKGGDFVYVPPAAGKSLSRFVEYVELGSHVEEYQGKPKPSAPQVRVGFELLAERNIREVEVEGGKKKVADRVYITMPKSQSEKSKFFKLFKAMAYGRTEITHMAQMLDDIFIVEVRHSDNGKTGAEKRIYANIYVDGQWLISSPFNTDVLTGNTTDLRPHCPPAIGSLRMFLMSHPNKECWDSLFVDGEREIKNADGTITKESKNWLQELIMSATDYEGSALHQMLTGVRDLPTEGSSAQGKSVETKKAAGLPDASTQTATESTGSSETASTAPAEAAKVSPSEMSPEDAMKALGL